MMFILYIVCWRFFFLSVAESYCPIEEHIFTTVIAYFYMPFLLDNTLRHQFLCMNFIFAFTDERKCGRQMALRYSLLQTCDPIEERISRLCNDTKISWKPSSIETLISRYSNFLGAFIVPGCDSLPVFVVQSILFKPKKKK